MPPSFRQELVGVFGWPVAENPTQAMIEPAFKAMGLDWRYLTVEVPPAQLANAVRGAVAMGWRGFNCTIPHKVAVIPLLTELSPAATAIGAVNCVVIRDGRLIGDNTDGKGFLQTVQVVRSIAGVEAVILGAGGAARAVAMELALAGARSITIVNRSLEKAEELALRVQKLTGVESKAVRWVGDYQPSATTDLLVQATSIGLYPDIDARVGVDLAVLKPGAIVCDVIPNPPRTRLIREAEALGLTALDGLGMLVNQGVIGIELWTGQTPDSTIMCDSLKSAFSE